MIRLSAPSACLLALAAIGVCGEAKPPKKLNAMDMIAEEEKWIFQPTVGREDVFVDLDLLLSAQKQIKQSIEESKHRGSTPASGTAVGPQGPDIDQLVAWAKGEEDRVRQSVAARKYEDAIKVAEATLKQLEPQATRPELIPIVVSIRTYRAQAEEAKIRNDAQAAFDALRIRLLGVLWSQEGARLAILDGATQALSVNEHFKDCVIINIDQDRVDFRFNFNRRRFEFPVYVDQPTGRSAP